MNGKGDKRRPSSVSKEKFDENWDRAFNRNTIQDDWNKPTDLWAFPPKKDKPLREVAYDGMWKHSCTTTMEVFWIGKDETCSYCSAWEEDGDDLPISLKD